MLDRIGIALFAIIALPIAIVPVALVLAIVTVSTGLVIAPWIATVAAIPLAFRMARAINETVCA